MRMKKIQNQLRKVAGVGGRWWWHSASLEVLMQKIGTGYAAAAGR